MKLFVRGSGTCVPTADRGPSGLVLSFFSHLIFFDGGGGGLRQMVKLGLDFRKIDYLGLTHFPPHHVSYFVLRFLGRDPSSESLSPERRVSGERRWPVAVLFRGYRLLRQYRSIGTECRSPYFGVLFPGRKKKRRSSHPITGRQNRPRGFLQKTSAHPFLSGFPGTRYSYGMPERICRRNPHGGGCK